MNSRFEAVEKAFNHEPKFSDAPAKLTSEYYGCKVFDRPAMRKYLPPETRKMIYDAIDESHAIDNNVARYVADGMKQWALDMGATHYTHWFHPLTGGVAEKHDSFMTPYKHGECIEEFSGEVLAQQEPDASSFPSGGLRNTFEARGYTAWDPSSPAFVMGDTLYIPTVFISYTGEALDHKTPLLKSLAAIDRTATEVARYFDSKVSHTKAYLGWEQEYFLVDKELYELRPDLIMTDRTLMGHSSAKNQQLDDHYLGAIPQRVLAYMQELEFEAYKLGIPLKTRHNETAPNQFELAPVYEEMNRAVDHNLLIMSIMKNLAEKHGFKVLLHEKPFIGVNGSGKHCNWSLATDTGINLFAPGKTEQENLRFLTFMAVTLMAVYKNNSVLKASVATASNAYRLGAHEAPPAIISSFLGSQVTAAFDKLLKNKDIVSMTSKKGYKIDVPQIPELLLDNTDRNRTSPFAFTGNRFEYRAVGASANCASAMCTLNTVVAYQLLEFKKTVDSLISGGMDKEQAIITTVRDYYKKCRKICFDGNGYSEEWAEEAMRRGLDCERSVPLIYDSFLTKESRKIFGDMRVMTATELQARTDVYWETYCKKVEIEARVISDLSQNHIVPVATKYQSQLLYNVAKMREIFTDPKTGDEMEFKKLSESQIGVVRDISGHIGKIRTMAHDVDRKCDDFKEKGTPRERAIAFHDEVVPLIDALRIHIDALEMIVDDEMWPLPKYRELLFIR